MNLISRHLATKILRLDIHDHKTTSEVVALGKHIRTKGSVEVQWSFENGMNRNSKFLLTQMESPAFDIILSEREGWPSNA